MLNGNPVTNLETPEFVGATNPGVSITVFETQVGSGSTFQFTLPASDINANGSFSFLFQNPPGGSGTPIPNGTFQVYVQASFINDPNHVGPGTSNTVTFVIDNTTPAAVTDFRLNPADDTGIVGDNLTTDRMPHFIGTAPAGDTIELVQLINFTGTLASRSASVTGVSSTTPLLVGDGVTGPGIPSGTTILSVNTNATITLSAAATSGGSQSLTATAPQNTATVGFTGTLTMGSASVTGIGSTTGLVAGDSVTGAGIPSGTTILTVNSSTTITLSARATSSGPQTLAATSVDAKGNPFDFSIQLPFSLTNGSIELGVIVIDVLSGNASVLSNPVTLSIVSIASDYNADSFSDAAFSAVMLPPTRGCGSLKLHRSARRIPLRSGSPAARPSAHPASLRSRATSMATASPIWRTTSPVPRSGLCSTRRPTPCRRSR